MREAALRRAAAEPGAARRARRLACAALALAALATGLIVLGALVRAHGAGLACPDWPLCFGELVPRFDFHVAFEYAHRALAGTVSLLFAGFAFAALRDARLRPHVARPLALGAALLALQVVLGGLTVLRLLAAWTVTSHLVVGNAFNATLLWTALTLREAGRDSPAGAGPAADARARPEGTGARAGALRALAAAAGLLALQLALGGLVSSTYAGTACPEWPACNGGSWFPAWRGSVGLHLAHRWNAYLLVAALAAAAWAARGVPRTGRLAALAAALGLAQAGVGVANVLLGIPVEVTALHSLLAALLVLTLTAALHSSTKGSDPARCTPAR
jgi:cytochrome c oxidase assembly protein subunit 15